MQSSKSKVFYLLEYHICQGKTRKQKGACKSRLLLLCSELVVSQPFLDLGLSHAQNVLGGVDGSLAAADMQEVQALGSLVQILFVTSGIAQLAIGVSLDQGSGLGVVLLLADDLLHDVVLLSSETQYECYYTHFCP